jgi:hypothetical protein
MNIPGYPKHPEINDVIVDVVALIKTIAIPVKKCNDLVPTYGSIQL